MSYQFMVGHVAIIWSSCEITRVCKINTHLWFSSHRNITEHPRWRLPTATVVWNCFFRFISAKIFIAKLIIVIMEQSTLISKSCRRICRSVVGWQSKFANDATDFSLKLFAGQGRPRPQKTIFLFWFEKKMRLCLLRLWKPCGGESNDQDHQKRSRRYM